ncbi:BA75_05007T0 [Komagataella pastoris]|uniref:BA75_05007T0 n=1 Tax=Komagataella pastoris TaxID=4922 RepID=A0A1B2JHC1_PICPA|nr:BA75_05007T0 [Komagataella pastoris]
MSDNANETSSSLVDNVYLDSSDLIVARYDKWILAVTFFENFFARYDSILSNTAKDYSKLVKHFSTDTLPQFEVSPSSNNAGAVYGSVNSEADPNRKITGVNSFIELLKFRSSEDQGKLAGLETSIKEQILPEFKKFSSDLSTKKKDLAVEAGKHRKELKKLGLHLSSSISKLQHSIQVFESASGTGKMDYKNDPYMLKRSVSLHGTELIAKEHNHIDFLKREELSLMTQEKRSLEFIQLIFADVANRIAAADAIFPSSFDSLTKTLSSIDLEYEWKQFSEVNKQKLVSVEDNEDVSAANASADQKKRSLNDLSFPNDHHPATEPILEGVLQRKEGKVNKKYVSSYYVITKTRYLYEFESNSPKNSTQPNTVLYLPECSLKSLNGPDNSKFKIEVSGKDATQAISVIKSTLILKTSTYDEMKTWFNVLSEVSGLMQTQEESRLDTST